MQARLRFVAALASDIGEDAAIDALAAAARAPRARVRAVSSRSAAILNAPIASLVASLGKNTVIHALCTALGNDEAIGVLKAELGKHQEARVTDLPREVLALILCHLTLAHDIAKVAPTSRGLRDAVSHAFLARPFSGEVVTIHSPPRDVFIPGTPKRGVMCVAAASDGRVITGLADRTVNVYGLRSMRIKAHNGTLRAVAVLPDGRFMTASNDCSVKVWKGDGSLESSIAVDGRALSLAVMPDGAHFVVGISLRDDGVESPIGQVRLYDFAGSLIHNFEGHARPVRAVAVTRDGRHIISGAGLPQSDHETPPGGEPPDPEKRVLVWNVAEKRLLNECTWTGDDIGGVNALAVMPDDKHFLSGGHDATVRVWLIKNEHLADSNLLLSETHLHHDERVRGQALVAMPDNKHALCAFSDATIKLFSVPGIISLADNYGIRPRGTILRTFKHHSWSTSSWNGVKCLALLPDGLRFVSGSHDGTACIVYHGLAPTKV